MPTTIEKLEKRIKVLEEKIEKPRPFIDIKQIPHLNVLKLLLSDSDPTLDNQAVRKKYVDDKIDNILGNWENKSVNTVYQANTAGFVVAHAELASGSGASLNGYTDSNNPPATLRVRDQIGSDYHTEGSIVMPVKKNDYWKITRSSTDISVTIYWIPLT